jgi:hypothetical protein
MQTGIAEPSAYPTAMRTKPYPDEEYQVIIMMEE